ncbi:hypothetical protein QBC33DRAFT_564140 [Phialemonium atrogriseum]|uniref:Uncharacterized protein n=1 Tax=Phialemonium atrogriseum TaxID=1093897 RepID=A0AAJ0BQB4_9PEZI|nr:uncharacterized protein QBC33DRAFT_564140 [Phialemonium atrogriseum]KAK1762122.1 hypothetical protein QBC33DRAFT_564140 [Phialemonium atrogriseum]
MDPILYETQFWKRAYDPDELPRLIFILHAMVVAAAQFVDRDRHPQFYCDSERLCARSWNAVLLATMDQLSVEDLQAFIIGAFNDVRTCPLGGGNSSKAWSIVGSLMRTIEYLQLSIESGNHENPPLL